MPASLGSIGSIALEQVEKNEISLFSGQTERQTETNQTKKLPNTLLGPTRMLCVNSKPITLVVLKLIGKTDFFGFFCGQTERQTNKTFLKVVSNTLCTNTDGVCEFQFNPLVLSE